MTTATKPYTLLISVNGNLLRKLMLVVHAENASAENESILNTEIKKTTEWIPQEVV